MNPKSLLLSLSTIALFAYAAKPAARPAYRQTQTGTIAAVNSNLASGTPSPNSTVVAELGGVLNSVSIWVQGTYSATLVVQVTADNANWVTLPNSSYTKVSDGSTGAVSGAGMWTVGVAGLAARVTCSAYTSGSAAVSLVPYAAGGGGGSGGGGGGGTVTANAGANLNTSALALETGGNLATVAGAVSSGKVNVNVSSGTAAATESGTWTVQPGNTANTTAWLVAPPGWSGFYLTSSGLSTTQTVSGAAGRFGGYMICNLNSAPAYIEVFDTTGSVTLGTTTPSFEFVLPANSTAANGLAANVEFANGLTVSSGIKIAAVTASKGSTPVSTGIAGTVFYR